VKNFTHVVFRKGGKKKDDVQEKGGGGKEHGLMQCKIFFQKHGSK